MTFLFSTVLSQWAVTQRLPSLRALVNTKTHKTKEQRHDGSMVEGGENIWGIRSYFINIISASSA